MEENNKDNINDANANDSSYDDNRNDDNLNIYDQENDHKSPHESSSVTSIDGPTKKESSWKSFWTKKKKIIAGGIVLRWLQVVESGMLPMTMMKTMFKDVK